MDIFLQVLILVVGFVLLIKGADWLISGASSVASNFKVPKILIGLTIIAFGTGAPELAVSISSIASGNTDMMLGNVVGSNILNILLLVGVGAIVAPIIVKKNTVKKELPILLLISTILVVLFLDPQLSDLTESSITRADAIICLLVFGVFVYYLVSMAKKKKKNTEIEKPKYKLGMSFLITFIGLVGVVVGSQLVVNSASSIATAFGVTEKMISLTIVALGTSLPELVTTITAAKRHENDLLLGNIIGSNIMNICIVMALPILIGGTVHSSNFDPIDLIMLVFSAFLIWLLTFRDHKITRKEGVMMLAIFVLYYSYVIYSGITGISIL